jgi:hypothetical protein
MSDQSIAVSPQLVSQAAASAPVSNRPMAARTKLLLEGRILPTLLRVAAPNVLNLLAIAGIMGTPVTLPQGCPRPAARCGASR